MVKMTNGLGQCGYVKPVSQEDFPCIDDECGCVVGFDNGKANANDQYDVNDCR